MAESILFDDYTFKVTANSDIVVRRRLQLFVDKFVTYHDFENDKQNKKTWYMDRRCELTPTLSADIIYKKKFIRPRGRWTITATVTGGGEEITLYLLSIQWPTRWAAKGYSSFTFGFEDISRAQMFHTCVASSIDMLKQGQFKPLRPSFSLSPSSSNPIFPAKRGTSLKLATQQSENGTLDGQEHYGNGLVEEPWTEQPGLDQPASNLLSEGSDDPNEEGVPVQERSNQEMAAVWVPFRQTNGVAIYHHVTHDEVTGVGGEYMVSAVVRGSPRDVKTVLLSTSPYLTILGPALSCEVLRPASGEGDKEILRIVLEAPGLAGTFLAPREMVVERVLRRDAAGLYVLLFSPATAPPQMQSIGRRSATSVSNDGSNPSSSQPPAKARSRSWYKNPVLGMVRGGYTIAPRLDHDLDTSPETLLTCIIKVDLGSACGERSIWKPLCDMSGFTGAFLDRILMTVTLVRDKVEHRQFRIQHFPFYISGAADVVEDNRVIPAIRSTSRLVQMTGGGSFPTSAGGKATLPSQANAAEHEEMCHVSYTEGTPMFDIEYVRSLSTLDRHFWEGIHEPGQAAPFRVRGAAYLHDRKKIPAGTSMFQLASIEVIDQGEAPIQHIARFLPCVRSGGIPFGFVIHLVIPGTPLLGIVATFVSDYHPDVMGEPPADQMAEDHDWEPFDFVVHKYLHSTDHVRNHMLKLIPHIADGSWMIKQSVGTTPVILGKALKTTYHVTPQYMEIDIDISANKVANYVTGLVRGTTKSLVIDLAFVLEGTNLWELPEALIGAFRVHHLDLSYAKKLDTTHEIPLTPPQVTGNKPMFRRHTSRY